MKAPAGREAARHDAPALEPTRLELALEDAFDALGRCAAEVHEFLAARGLSPRAVYRADLVLEEIVTNIIRHGYDDTGPHTIAVAVALQTDTLTLTFEDDGRAFDPLAAPEPELPDAPDAIPTGGRGLRLVRAMIRDGEYLRRDGRNRLTVHIARTG
jgi:serine/threonine-protein kinase RsbW